MDFKKILFKTSTIDADNALPDAMVYIGKDGEILWVNDLAAEIFDTSKMHLLTSEISDFIETGVNIIKSSISANGSTIVKLKDKEVYYDMTSREIDGGYVISLRETLQISNKSTEEDPAVINREKNNFLIKLSNDLKAPIQSIVGFSQAMSDGLGGKMSEQQEKYLRIINKNSADLMYFIGKLLEMSQSESALKQPDKKPLDVTALVNSVVKFNEQLFKEKDIKISVESQEGLKRTINTDSDILKNILQDILEVIIKSVDMGEVNISISNPDEEFLKTRNIREGIYTFISVSSSALLFSENDLDCIFDPYKIVDSTNRKNVLRAIVLSTVKNLVQNIGGAIWVESQILKNTSFNIIIPE